MMEDAPGASSGPHATPREAAASVASALTLGYSAPMPGVDSRYSDGTEVAHETRLLGVPALAAAAGSAGVAEGVGEVVLEAVLGSFSETGHADVRAAGYLAPLARAALLGEPVKKVLAGLTREDARSFARALEVSGGGGSAGRRAVGASAGGLAGALEIALSSGRGTTLRDAMRFAGSAAGASGDPLVREYARDFEVTRELARPALEAALLRAEATRPALVEAYLVVLSEVPDLDVAGRAGRKEAEEVSRMAGGVLKSGGVRSRRGLQAISNLDGLLRSDPRLKPSATETPVIAAAFLLALARGPGYLNGRVRPATGR